MNDNYAEVKTQIDDGYSPWGVYSGKSVGRMLNYVYHICGYNYADLITFGHTDGLIHYDDKPFASVDHSKGYPYFTFLGEFAHFNKKQDTFYVEKPG